MQDAYGNMTISVFNATDIDPKHRVDYFEKFGINEKNKKKFFKENNIESINPDNRYVPIQRSQDLDYIELGAGLSLPAGLIFMNSDPRDKSIYEIVKNLKTKDRTIACALVRKGKASNIRLDGETMKNGVMVLKHIAKKARGVVFRGNQQFINKQYNIVSNPYKKIDKPIEGESLSIIAR
jgi:hypothetical protein